VADREGIVVPAFDMPLEELREYRPDRREPADFDAFWASTLAEARQEPIDLRLEPVESGLRTIDAFDATFRGFGGQPIKGWLLLPAVRSGSLPIVVEYIGYGGGRGIPLERLVWSSAGYANFIMDNRGQGTWGPVGGTPDAVQEVEPAHPGYMTRGISDPSDHFYRRLMTDAVRAIDAVHEIEGIDQSRIAAFGGSQGGGLSLAVAGLEPRVGTLFSDVPFLCHYRRATEITEEDPYGEIVRYLRYRRDRVERVFGTLAYFDGMNFAARAEASALFSVGLMDNVCPPSTVFAAYNHYRGPKQIRVWPFNVHEGGGAFQRTEQLRFLADAWG
jgi:cephalosporin-C deacetylase